MLSMKNALILIVMMISLIGIVFGGDCPNPRQSYFISYKSLSKSGYINRAIQKVNVNLPMYSMTLTQQVVYKIIDFQFSLSYNDHQQQQKITNLTSQINKQQSRQQTSQLKSFSEQSSQPKYSTHVVNVSLGKLYLNYHFHYDIHDSSGKQKNMTGIAKGRVQFDHINILKQGLVYQWGQFYWRYYLNQDIPLKITPVLQISSSVPSLDLGQQIIFISMLQGYSIDFQLIPTLISVIHPSLKNQIQNHMNLDFPIKRSGQIQYSYGNYTFPTTFSYYVGLSSYQMNNSKDMGMEIFLNNNLVCTASNQCLQVPNDFDVQSYGGLQEVYSMGLFRDTFRCALQRGYANRTLDRTYQVSQFQFYIGDLASFVDYANNLPAIDRFEVICTFTSSRSSQAKLSRLDDQTLYTQIPYQCLILYRSEPVLKVTFSMVLLIKLVALEDELKFTFSKVQLTGDKYQSIDKNFVITNLPAARYAVTAVLRGLIGKETFGTKWKITKRKFPVVRVLDDYIVLFDPAEK